MPRPACRQAGNIKWQTSNANLKFGLGYWIFPCHLSFDIFNSSSLTSPRFPSKITKVNP